MARVLSRDEAFDLIKKNVTRRNVLCHMLAVEALMRGTARYLEEDAESWDLVGLLHDVDYEKTETTPERHTLVASELLDSLVSDEVMRAIKAHNYPNTHVMPESRMEKALIACDAVSGLLVACALVMPSKKLADVKVESVAKKFKDKDFARGADRQRILMCEELGIPKERFLAIALEELKDAASEIGL